LAKFVRGYGRITAYDYGRIKVYDYGRMTVSICPGLRTLPSLLINRTECRFGGKDVASLSIRFEVESGQVFPDGHLLGVALAIRDDQVAVFHAFQLPISDGDFATGRRRAEHCIQRRPCRYRHSRPLQLFQKLGPCVRVVRSRFRTAATEIAFMSQILYQSLFRARQRTNRSELILTCTWC
jgi:hypothetical protein